MLLLPLQKKHKQPLYIQIYEGIKQQILHGQLLPGEKLPSKKQFISDYKISQNTLQNALFLLLEEGYITSKERQGYYIAPIEHLQTLPSVEESVFLPPTEEEVRYNFSYSGVDIPHFPAPIFRRITKNLFQTLSKDLFVQGDVQGYLPLRQEICRYLKNSRGFEISPEQVIIGAGTETLFPIVLKLFSENTLYALESPGFKLLSQLLEAYHIPYKNIPVDTKGISISHLEKSAAQIACITPSHQFPTGVIMPISTRQQLLKWALTSKDHYVVEDDYDSEFKYTGRPIPALKAIDTQDRVIYISSFSKSISPALRVSYMVVPKPLLQRYQERIPYIQCPVSTIVQSLLYLFLAEGHFEKHINRMRTLYKKKRDILLEALQQEMEKKLDKPLRIEGSDAGVHLLITLPKNCDIKRLKNECRDRKIKISMMDQVARCGHNEETSKLVLGYASLPLEDMEEAVYTLIQGIKYSISLKN